MTKKILVIGSGAWGTAIANHLGNNNNQVFLYTRQSDYVKHINDTHRNPKIFSQHVLSKNIIAVNEYLNDVDFVFLAIPSDSMLNVLDQLRKIKFTTKTIFVNCTKGIYEVNHNKSKNKNNLCFFSDYFLEQFCNFHFAILCGPNFAAEVIEKIPTVTTIGCISFQTYLAIKDIIENNFFKTYYSSAIKCIELSGSIKNILAIGCGLIHGLGLGINAKSALLIKGIEEIKSLCKALQIQEDLTTPAGFGDIFLTCSSEKSRNYSLGISLSKAQEIPSNVNFEGQKAALLINDFAKKLNLKLDLCELIAKIINKQISIDNYQQEITKVIV
ncbi:glycerol-3-phosphate dehydrogenase [NAD(P)+] [Alphaproteobacteria bacterium]|nr:glycerol-3-phosphate dehydrogenase [NAD(P)+] [Alphaproteobacteria bacterium]